MANIVCIGNIYADLVVNVNAMPATGTAVEAERACFYPGGQSLGQAVALQRQGHNAQLFGCMGDDVFATEIETFLKTEGIDMTGVAKVKNCTTALTNIVVTADGANTMLWKDTSNMHLTPAGLNDKAIAQADALVCTTGVPTAALKHALQIAADNNVLSVLNPSIDSEGYETLLNMANVLVMNAHEFVRQLNQPVNHAPAYTEEMLRQHFAHKQQTVVITLGKNGAVAMQDDEIVYCPAKTVQAKDTTGAGDCFIASLTSQLVQNVPLAQALEFAAEAAAFNVQRSGASVAMPYLKDLQSKAA